MSSEVGQWCSPELCGSPGPRGLRLRGAAGHAGSRAGAEPSAPQGGSSAGPSAPPEEIWVLRKPFTGRWGVRGVGDSHTSPRQHLPAPPTLPPLILAGGERSGSLSSGAGGRSGGGHALHAGAEGVKVGTPGWCGEGPIQVDVSVIIGSERAREVETGPCEPEVGSRDRVGGQANRDWGGAKWGCGHGQRSYPGPEEWAGPADRDAIWG